MLQFSGKQAQQKSHCLASLTKVCLQSVSMRASSCTLLRVTGNIKHPGGSAEGDSTYIPPCTDLTQVQFMWGQLAW